jgi:uncharacterized protein CbrC (UPF0167 family)
MEIVMPDMTGSYHSREDRGKRICPFQGAVPWCIAETSDWAADKCRELFEQEPGAVNDLVAGQDRVDSQLIVNLRGLDEVKDRMAIRSFSDA